MSAHKAAIAATVGSVVAGAFTLATFHLPSPDGGQMLDQLLHRQKQELPTVPAVEVLEKYASENLIYIRQQRRPMLWITILRDEATALDRLERERTCCAGAALYLAQYIPPTLLGNVERRLREIKTIADLGLLPRGIGQRVAAPTSLRSADSRKAVSARSKLRTYYQREYRHFKDLSRLAEKCKRNEWENRASMALQAEFKRVLNLSASFEWR